MRIIKKRVCLVSEGDFSNEYFYPTVDILKAMNLNIEWVEPIIEGDRTSFEPPEQIKQAIDGSDATLMGNLTDFPSITNYLKWGKMTYAHIRPVKYFQGCNSPLKNPTKINYIIVRENLEGLYPGREGDIKYLSLLNIKNSKNGQELDIYKEGKFAIRIITVENTKKIAKYACELAMKRKKSGFMGKITCATKSNMLYQTCGLFRSIAEEVIRNYPELIYEHFLIDELASRLVTNPEELDIVLTSNIFGDIYGDIGAATVGGYELAPRAAIGDDYGYFDTLIGHQTDLAGKNIVNPSAMILSAAMMLEYLGYETEALRLEETVHSLYHDRRHLTIDKEGTVYTSDFCREVKARLKH